MERLKRIRSDWSHYRREALMAGAVMLVALVMLVGAWHWLDASGEARAKITSALQSSRAELTNVENERADLIASIPVYTGMHEQGIIGAEDRLKWREVLAEAKNFHQMEKLSYTLSGRQAFVKETPASAGGAPSDGLFRRYRSTMLMELAFDHEKSFVELIEDVISKTSALPLLRQCTISRNDQSARSEGSARSALMAQCRLDWATLEKAQPVGGVPGL